MSDEIVLSHESGATTKVTVLNEPYAGRDTVIVEVDTDAGHETPVRVYVNDVIAYEGRVQ